MRPRLLVLSVLTALVATAVPGSVSAAAADAPTWIADALDPASVLTAVETHDDKIPAEFNQRLSYVGDDGTIRVMVSVTRRTPALESFVEANTQALAWYGDAPRFYASILQDDLVALLASPDVVFVEPDYILTEFNASSVVDIRARADKGTGNGIWSYDADGGQLLSEVPGLSADQATGKGITVAVTDSGLDRTHRDFDGWGCEPVAPYQPCDSRVLETVVVDEFIGAGFDVGDVPTSDFVSGHGTHVAGTIAGNSAYTRMDDADPVRYGGDGNPFGVAPQASLINTKNGDSQWAGLSTFGLQWQADNAAEYGIRVSSNSWGCLGGCSFNGSSAIAQTFRDLYNAGVLVVFAVGNDAGGPNGAAFSGNAQSPYVLGVAAYDDANDQLASFSSRGQAGAPLYDPMSWTPESEPVNGTRRPDVAAPGVSIWSARSLTGGTSSLQPRTWSDDVADVGAIGVVPYASLSGTSMATPHVAGVAALLFSACPEAAPLDVMRAIMASADSTKVSKTGSTTTAEPFEAGYGAVDARAALDTHGCGVTNEAPTAAITAPVEATADALVTFDGSASTDPDGAIESFTWDFGDGSPTVSGPTVEHSFRNADVYEVTLIVKDNLGVVGSTTHSITVVDPGVIAGSVTDFGKRDAIAGASVDCGDGLSAVSSTDGSYSIGGLSAGTYTCTASAVGYRSETLTTAVEAGQTSIGNYQLKRGRD